MIHRALVLTAFACCALVLASFAASTLTSPFHSIVQSDSQLVLHGLPTLFALLVYGVGLGYLARFSRGLS